MLLKPAKASGGSRRNDDRERERPEDARLRVLFSRTHFTQGERQKSQGGITKIMKVPAGVLYGLCMECVMESWDGTNCKDRAEIVPT